MATDLVVVGLGYVGLPLVAEGVRDGLSVVGLDINSAVVDGLNAGTSHIDDLSDEDIEGLVRGGFVASVDPAVMRDASTIVLCVPTPLADDGTPDLGAVLAATETVAEHMSPGTLVVLESTTFPGTTDDVVRPLLEAAGRVVGEDFYLAFSPERIDPGNPKYGLRNTPKVVGGCTPACTERATDFYARLVDTVVQARGPREAETAKLLENTYRHVNIALVNEMARFCHELQIDLWDVVRLAATKPFGFQAFYPGPGVGGHCIPIDPNYLAYSVRSQLGYPFRFVELAQEVNSTMPKYVARRIQDALNQRGAALKGAKVLLLGVTYKANIADQRESPSREVAKALLALGADVSFHDPFVETWIIDDREIPRVPSYSQGAAEADSVVLLQAHDEYDVAVLEQLGDRLFDTRGVTRSSQVDRI